MKLHEALTAVEYHALCKYQDSLYYAYGITYVNRLMDKPRVSIQLHDRRAPSVMTVNPRDVSVVSWREANAEDVQKALKRYEALFAGMSEGAKT